MQLLCLNILPSHEIAIEINKDVNRKDFLLALCRCRRFTSNILFSLVMYLSGKDLKQKFQQIITISFYTPTLMCRCFLLKMPSRLSDCLQFANIIYYFIICCEVIICTFCFFSILTGSLISMLSILWEKFKFNFF